MEHSRIIFFLRWRVRFRERWLKKKIFASWNDVDELKKTNNRNNKTNMWLCHILQHPQYHTAYFSKKFCLGGAFEGKFGRWGEGGNRKRNNLFLFDKVTISFCLIKYPIGSLVLSFTDRRLLSKEPENLISWHDRSAESVFSNLFPEWGTSVFFALSHAMYLLREMRNENKQRLRSERVAFWLTWMISYEDF